MKDPEFEKAWVSVEYFCAVSLRVLAKTNASKIRSEAVTTEVCARLSGRPVLSAE